MSKNEMSPLGAVARGLATGVVATGVMTIAQELVAKLQSSGGGGGGDEPPSWDDASAPAEVGRRIIEGVFQKDAPPEMIPTLTNAMHWGYGVGWGAAFGLVQGTVRHRALGNGLGFGMAVWGASYLQLIPMGLYEPPWKYGVQALATEGGFHLAYGLGAGLGWSAIEALTT